MGTWGPGVFSDDTASDVRYEYRDLIGDGLTSEEATAKLEGAFIGDVPDSDVEAPFWLGLAATQWKMGRLTGRVLSRALQMIEDGSALALWNETPDRDRKQRAKALEKLRVQLLSPQPAAKVVRPRYRAETDFKIGDIIRYQLHSGRDLYFLVTQIHVDQGGAAPVLQPLDTAGITDEEARTFPRAAIKRLRLLRTTLVKRGFMVLHLPRAAIKHLRLFRRGPMFLVYRTKRDYPANRLMFVTSVAPIPKHLVPPKPRWDDRSEEGHTIIIPWKRLDEFLYRSYGLL